MRKIVLAFLCLGLSKQALPQTPQVASGSVVNGASWGGIVSPGSLVSVFGSNLAPSAQWANAPLPLTLGGTSVSVNGISAPLAFVSPGQINLQLPSSVVIANDTIAGGSLVVTTPAGSSAPAQFSLSATDPAFFTVDSSGCGQAAAENILPDGTVSINSHADSAAPGDVIAIWGTGFGLATTQPPDGTAATGAVPLRTQPELVLDGTFTPAPLYAGLAPSFAGVDQIDFQIPLGTRNGCSVPLGGSAEFGSPLVTISVQAGRGPCIDPPITSWGQISFFRSTISGPGTSSPSQFESYTATFSAGPAVQAPAPPQIVFAPFYIANISVGGVVRFINGSVPISSNDFPSCAVPGYAQLSAGIIQLQTPGAGIITTPPLAVSDGVTYSQTLPAGSIVPGTYTIAGTPGNPVTLQTSFHIGSPIQIQNAFSPGTAISSQQPLTVSWTGGDPGALVEVALISAGKESYTYADAAAGSLTISPSCTGNPSPAGNGVVCNFGVPPSSTTQIDVTVSPAPNNITATSVPGITGPVQINWTYSYAFTGLSLTP